MTPQHSWDARCEPANKQQKHNNTGGFRNGKQERSKTSRRRTGWRNSVGSPGCWNSQHCGLDSVHPRLDSSFLTADQVDLENSMSTQTRNVQYSCPSAQPNTQGAVLLGVRQPSDSGTQIAYVDRILPVTDALLAKTGSIEPTEVLRFAAPCQERKCQHFNGTDCRLITRIVQILPAVVDSLPPCTIRATCRWFGQEGRSACVRCPQIVSRVLDPSPELRRAGTPE